MGAFNPKICTVPCNSDEGVAITSILSQLGPVPQLLAFDQMVSNLVAVAKKSLQVFGSGVNPPSVQNSSPVSQS